MPKRVLLLGGTGEARVLASRLAHQSRLELIYSLAGRLSRTNREGLESVRVRCGGFRDALGFRQYLAHERISLVLDVTHPFAVRISSRAFRVCRQLDIPYWQVERPAWTAVPEDCWIKAHDMDHAAALLHALSSKNTSIRNVFLTVGAHDLHAFFPGHSDTSYWVRAIEQPAVCPVLPTGMFFLIVAPFLMKPKSPCCDATRFTC